MFTAEAATVPTVRLSGFPCQQKGLFVLSEHKMKVMQSSAHFAAFGGTLRRSLRRAFLGRRPPSRRGMGAGEGGGVTYFGTSSIRVSQSAGFVTRL